MSLNLDSDGNGGGIIVVGGTATVDATDVDCREDEPYWAKYSEDAKKLGLTGRDGPLQHPADDHPDPGVDHAARLDLSHTGRMFVRDTPEPGGSLRTFARRFSGSRATSSRRPG